MPAALTSSHLAVAFAGGATLAASLVYRMLRTRPVSKALRLSKSSSIKLVYLDARSAGEPIRLALYIGGIPFEDQRVSYPQIAEMRDSGYLPFGQVPALEINGKVFAQSQALLRWVGWHTGLYPEHVQLQMDQIDEAVVDIKYVLRPAWYGAALGRNPKTGEPLLPLSTEQCQATIEALNTIVLPARLAQLERLLVMTSGGPFVCGELMTIADLNLYVFAAGIRDGSGVPPGISTSLLDECPRISQVVEEVARHPKVAEWNRRPTTSPVTSSEGGTKTVTAF